MVESLDEKGRKMSLLRDEIFLQGFGAPFSSEHKLRSTSEFQHCKKEVKEMDDFLTNVCKARMKLVERTHSLSNSWLKEGQSFSKQLWGALYAELRLKGFESKDALHLLTGLLDEVEVNRQTCVISTKSSIVESIGIPNLKLPLLTSEGGISGKIGDKIESSIKNVRSELIELCRQPKPELLFERAVQLSKNIHR